MPLLPAVIWENFGVCSLVGYPAENGTLVSFGHRGWRRADGAMAPCNTVWGALMHRLRDYAEGVGRGPYFPG